MNESTSATVENGNKKAVKGPEIRKKKVLEMPTVQGVTAETTENLDNRVTPAPTSETAPETPTRYCACGCGSELTSSNSTRLFLQGHDAKIKSLLRKVGTGEVPGSTIPQITLDNIDGMPFLFQNRELRKICLAERQRRQA